MIRVFPRRTKWTPTDALAFVGDPPLFRPPVQPVAVSVTFVDDINEGLRLQKAWSAHYPDVEVGGPAFGDPGHRFIPGRFLKPGVTITSRGCPARCPWCFVPQREGGIREYPIQDGYILQDNNILACSDGHVARVFEMLRRQKRGIVFSGGIDTARLRWHHLDLFRSVRVSEIWVACDTNGDLPALSRAAEILKEFPTRKKRCYAMVGFDGEHIIDASERMKKILDMGFLPFCQLYQGPTKRYYSREWRALAKKWARPAAYRST